jgi:hypothetical protein
MVWRTIACLVVLFPALTWSAAQAPEGRWEGQIRIPGREQRVVLDLSTTGSARTGSIILPGLGIKGAPLSNIVATGSSLSFDMPSLLDTPNLGPAHFKVHLDGGAMGGEMRQGGNVAPMSLKRIGPAQVDVPSRSTPVRPSLASEWTGDFELGGYPRHVTLTLANHSGAAATATLVVVGKRTTDLPIDIVTDEGRYVRVESHANQAAFEGRFIEERDEIEGAFTFGPYELPLVLRRSGPRPS